jgi:hypothetical protein
MSVAGAKTAYVTPGSQTLIAHIRRALRQRRDREQLALAREIVFGSAKRTSTRACWSDEQLAHAIRANIAADHEAGRVVDAGRWQISVTESRALELMGRLRLG